MAVNVSQKDKTIEHVRERLSQAYCEISPHVPDSAIQYLDANEDNPQILDTRLRIQ